MTAELFLKNATAFFLVFIRVLAMMSVAPVFNDRGIPFRVRILQALVLAGMMFPLVALPAVEATGVVQVLVVAGREVLVGLLMGYAAGFIFYAVQFAGDIMSFQAGFTSMLSVDPATLETVTVLARVQSTIALVLYVLLDGHHFLLRALSHSFEQVPLLAASFPTGLLESFTRMAGASITMGLQISGPVLVATSLVNLALAILSRTMPQLNILAVSFPLVIGAGVMVLIKMLPAFARIFHQLMGVVERDVMAVIRLLGS
jgi:flagellar biosynthetic protein FliR